MHAQAVHSSRLVSPARLAICVLSWLLAGAVSAHAGEMAQGDRDPTPTLDKGAQIFVERCALCHGQRGMGEGLMPLLIRGYPDTNLLQAHQGAQPEEIRNAIIWGGSKGAMDAQSPPWGDELTWTEIESVVMFVGLLREQPEAAIALSRNVSSDATGGPRLGARVFRARCALCHGPNGEGNGRMARVIKTPPPANLRSSAAPAAYLRQIVIQGGANMGRSPKMPPWGDELSEAELNSVVNYILALRKAL